MDLLDDMSEVYEQFLQSKSSPKKTEKSQAPSTVSTEPHSFGIDIPELRQSHWTTLEPRSVRALNGCWRGCCETRYDNCTLVAQHTNGLLLIVVEHEGKKFTLSGFWSKDEPNLIESRYSV